MNLTYYTNYSLRVMMYLGLHDSSLASISQISEAYGISRNHLIKVVHNLARLGFIITTRGRGGGLRLARDPRQISIGEVVRNCESGFNLVECFNTSENTCPLTPSCELKRIVRAAQTAFLEVLDQYTLADLLGRRKAMMNLLGIENGKPSSPLWQRNGARRNGLRRRA